MLPVIGEYVYINQNDEKSFENKGVNLLDICNESGELEIFESTNLQNIIKFKWTTFAYRLHLRGCLFHLFYVLILILYVDKVYIQNDLEEKGKNDKRFYSIMIISGIIYPSIYEFVQQYKIGFRYLLRT